MKTNDFTWNYYTYCLININNGNIVDESDDLNYIKTMKKRYQERNTNGKYIIQQQHNVARIIR